MAAAGGIETDSADPFAHGGFMTNRGDAVDIRFELGQMREERIEPGRRGKRGLNFNGGVLAERFKTIDEDGGGLTGAKQRRRKNHVDAGFEFEQSGDRTA